MNTENNVWAELPAYPLQPELAALPFVTAVPWCKLAEGYHRPTLEGAVFDREGNLYACLREYPGSSILRITPERQVETLFHHGEACIIGLAIHRDGRFFAADIDGHIFVLRPDGTQERELLGALEDVEFHPNDVAFDGKGNLYFTNFTGNALNPTGGVYRLDESEDYKILHPVLEGLAAPNGVGFTPEGTALWVSETARNTAFQVNLDEKGNAKTNVFAIHSIYHANGYEMFDSLKVDKAGNCYIAVMYGGRALVLNAKGVPVGNILVEGREKGEYLFSPNLAIKPGTKEGYLLSSGPSGSWVFRFPAIAEGISED